MIQVEAKDRLKKAFDEATAQSEAESKQRWAKLEEDVKKTSASIGI
jgi:hypothetical protein